MVDTKSTICAVDVVSFLTTQKAALHTLFTADDQLDSRDGPCKEIPWLSQLLEVTCALHQSLNKVDYCGEVKSLYSRLATFDEVLNRNQDLYDSLDRVTTELEELRAVQEETQRFAQQDLIDEHTSIKRAVDTTQQQQHYEQLIAQMQSEMNGVIADFAECQLSVQELETMLTEEQKVKLGLQEQIAKLVATIEEKNFDLASYKENLKETQKQLRQYESTEEEFFNLRNEFDGFRRSTTSVQELNSQQVTDFQDKIRQYKRSIEKREKEITRLKMKLQESDTKLAELNDEVLMLRTQTQQATAFQPHGGRVLQPSLTRDRTSFLSNARSDINEAQLWEQEISGAQVVEPDQVQIVMLSGRTFTVPLITSLKSEQAPNDFGELECYLDDELKQKAIIPVEFDDDAFQDVQVVAGPRNKKRFSFNDETSQEFYVQKSRRSFAVEIDDAMIEDQNEPPRLDRNNQRTFQLLQVEGDDELNTSIRRCDEPIQKLFVDQAAQTKETRNVISSTQTQTEVIVKSNSTQTIHIMTADNVSLVTPKTSQFSLNFAQLPVVELSTESDTGRQVLASNDSTTQTAQISLSNRSVQISPPPFKSIHVQTEQATSPEHLLSFDASPHTTSPYFESIVSTDQHQLEISVRSYNDSLVIDEESAAYRDTFVNMPQRKESITKDTKKKKSSKKSKPQADTACMGACKTQ